MLEKYITNYLSKKGHNVDNMVKTLQKSRQKYGEKLSYEDALEELVCNTMSEIATDEEAMATFLELNESERNTLISVLRDIANKIREWARSLTGKEYRRLVTESETLRHLANELNKQLKGMEVKENTADGGVKYSLIEYSLQQKNNWLNSKRIVTYDNQAQLMSFIDEAINGTNLEKKMYFGKIGEDLADRILRETGIDVRGFNVTLKASEIRKILLKSHGDKQKESSRGQREITKEDLLLIPLIITEPDVVEPRGFTEKNKPVIGFQKTIKGKTTVISYVSDKHMDLTVKTMYSGKEKSLPTTADEESPAFTSETNSGTASTDSISNSEETVKKNSYADMIDLSADYDNAVEEYLRHKSRYNLNKVREIVNLAASKAMPDSVVKDESGLLTKVYHGTEAENFNVFDRERRGQTDSSLWGRGYYFTPDVEFASDFGENVRGFYLNITNPFIIGKVDAPASVIAVKFKSLGIPVDFDYRGIKAFEFANAFGNQRFTDVLMEKGFDGVIVEDFEYVVFEQNQMKLADAITYDDNGEVIPLSERLDESKTDIRYSRDDFSVDYSDLSILDDEQLDAYNKR